MKYFLILLSTTALATPMLVEQIIEDKIFDYAGIEKTKTTYETKTTGLSKLEIQRQKVREELMKKQGLTGQVTSGKDSVEVQKARARGNIKDIRSREKLSLTESADDWFTRKLKQQDQFIITKQKEIDETIKKWQEERRAYIKRVDQYKENLTPIPVPESTLKVEHIPVKTTIKLDKKLISGAFTPSIKDQGKRATCSAFAAIRAIEILAAQKNRDLDLSEQYFYWASKPKCRQAPCTDAGSWVGFGVEYSHKSTSLDIPTESNCPYMKSRLSRNDTQVPLKSGCSQGVVKIAGYDYVKSLDDVIKEIDQDHPVIVGTTLDAKYYNNEGLVFEGIETESGLDKHSKGHAYLLVGYMKLPEKLHSTEGKLCFIASNSWSEGWGLGGHACLSEKWLLRNMRNSPFVAISEIKI